jgi:hypothetical protein
MVWSRWEPAALRSSPARPAGRLPSRVPAVPESAKHFTHTIHTLFRFYYSIAIALALQRDRTRLNLAIAGR